MHYFSALLFGRIFFSLKKINSGGVWKWMNEKGGSDDYNDDNDEDYDGEDDDDERKRWWWWWRGGGDMVGR